MTKNWCLILYLTSRRDYIVRTYFFYDFAIANEELAKVGTDQYYSCCGKSICGGCIHSIGKSGNIMKCPHCKTVKIGKTDEETAVGHMMVEAYEAGLMCLPWVVIIPMDI